MKKQIYKWIFFQLMGWKIVGTIDSDIKKCVMMIMPHTSAHDFYLGIFTRAITGLEMNFVGKKELFVFPLGYYFKYMGGEPLDRSGGMNKVDQLKTGFYYIALKANIPIIPVAFNFGKKEVNLGTPLMPTGNIDEELIILKNHFKGVEGKIAEKGFRET